MPERPDLMIFSSLASQADSMVRTAAMCSVAAHMAYQRVVDENREYQGSLKTLRSRLVDQRALISGLIERVDSLLGVTEPPVEPEPDEEPTAPAVDLRDLQYQKVVSELQQKREITNRRIQKLIGCDPKAAASLIDRLKRDGLASNSPESPKLYRLKESTDVDQPAGHPGP